MRHLVEGSGPDGREGQEAGERCNAAPSQRVLAVVNDGTANRLVTFEWGLVPRWARGPRPRYTVNARAGTVAERPTFRSAFKDRR